MIRTHVENEGRCTIAALPVAEAKASSFGIMRIAGRRQGHRLRGEAQDPGETDPRPHRPQLDRAAGYARSRPRLPGQHGDLPVQRARPWSSSSNRATPPISARRSSRRRSPTTGCRRFLFDGYWEDIGTVGAFHQANLDLTRDEPTFDFTYGEQPIFTRPRYLPCSRISGATVRNSLICDGCIIGRGSVIENSVIGVRSIIGDNSTIRDSYLMGGDFYEQAQPARGEPASRPPEGRHRRRLGGRERHHRQERADRPEGQDHQRDGHRRLRGNAHSRDPRQSDRDPQVDHRPRRGFDLRV